MRFVDHTNPRDLLNAGLDSFARHAGVSAAEGDYQLKAGVSCQRFIEAGPRMDITRSSLPRVIRFCVRPQQDSGSHMQHFAESALPFDSQQLAS